MANVVASSVSSLQLSNPFPFPFPLSPSKPRNHQRTRPFLLFTTPATQSESDPSKPESEPTNDFDDRIKEFRVRYKSGTGKKAEIRKGRKSSSSSKKGTWASSVYLPPVPLKEAVSGGVKVELGFSPYSERLNGRMAILGLTALLLVELATGKSVINYHTPSIIFTQLYFVAALSAVYVKVEKEKISVWPPSSTN